MTVVGPIEIGMTNIGVRFLTLSIYLALPDRNPLLISDTWTHLSKIQVIEIHNFMLGYTNALPIKKLVLWTKLHNF